MSLLEYNLQLYKTHVNFQGFKCHSHIKYNVLQLRINYNLRKLIPDTAEVFKLCSYMLIALSSWVILAVNLK